MSYTYLMLLNIFGYYAVWWSIVYCFKTGDALFLGIISLLNLFLHFFFNTKNFNKELVSIVIITITGLLFDFSMNFFGVFELKGNFFLWLPIIWITFATMVNSSLASVLNKKHWVIFSIGLIAGPFSYFSAAKFELLLYTKSIGLVLLHGLSWGMFLIYLKIIRKKLK